MIAIGKMALEPILFLRDNVSLAIANPEAPNIGSLRMMIRIEVGGQLPQRRELIRQNAKTFCQVKSAAQSQIHKLAYYDTLTGLPNRLCLFKIIRARETGGNQPRNKMTRLAIVAFDLITSKTSMI